MLYCYLCILNPILILLHKQVQAELPTKWGNFIIYAYAQDREEQQPHIALIHKDVDKKQSVAVRIHSECITGDLFGSRRCDCGEQFEQSMKIIGENKGLMIYLRQEGRGIGLINKLDAYNLQDKGMDTFEANVHLGFEPDERDFQIAIEILNDLNINEIDLITNNPDKIAAIDRSDIRLVRRIPVIIPSKSENERYLKVKQDVMGHLL
ncbi:MAG: GTP cyclohydrolase II [Saprospiraceae bacterium]|nr:GTP cyclohydrolase II [Saprospiraceae bacterium]